MPTAPAFGFVPAPGYEPVPDPGTPTADGDRLELVDGFIALAPAAMGYGLGLPVLAVALVVPPMRGTP
jgi:hypothetical protein